MNEPNRNGIYSKLHSAAATKPAPECGPPDPQRRTSKLPDNEPATGNAVTHESGRYGAVIPSAHLMVPGPDDGWRTPQGGQREQFVDDRPFVGAVDVSSQDGMSRPQPSAYLVCVQRCAVVATVCLVIMAFGAVLAGVSKKKSQHAMLYIEVHRTTERTEPSSTRVREYALNDEGDEAAADMSRKHPTATGAGANSSRPSGTHPLVDDATTEADRNEDYLTSTVHALA